MELRGAVSNCFLVKMDNCNLRTSEIHIYENRTLSQRNFWKMLHFLTCQKALFSKIAIYGMCNFQYVQYIEIAISKVWKMEYV